MLEQLRKALADALKAAEPLEVKAFGDEATADDTTALETAMSGIEALQKKIKTAESLEAIRAAAAAPVAAPANAPAPAAAKTATEGAQKVGIVMQGMMKSFLEDGRKGLKATAAGIEALGYGGLATDLMDSHQKASGMSSTSGASGGVIIGEDFVPDIIPLLYAQSSFLAGSPIDVPMPRGSMRQPKGSSGASAGYRGEGTDISVSSPTVRDINMTAHLLSGIVPITNQLINYSLGTAERFARNDLGMAMSLAMDTMAYLGLGTDDDLLGIMNLPGTYSVAATGATTPTVAQVDSDARGLLNRLLIYPSLISGTEWRMGVTAKGYLEDLRDGNGNYVYPELRKENPTWKGGFPVRIAGTFPENLGSGTDESYIALISFGHTLVGNSKSLEFAISDSASIKVGSDMVSMFSTDQTAIRATMEHDVTTRYVEAVSYLSAVRWGQ